MTERAGVRVRGINYDTGFLEGRAMSRRSFDLDVVRDEMTVIARDLHADAVRVSGADPERLVIAGEAALDAGLELWFSPFPYDLDEAQLVAYLGDCARRAEALRQRGGRVTLVLGCELSLFCSANLPGGHLWDRLATMTAPPWPSAFQHAFAALPTTLNRVLASALVAARDHFGGPITYASGSWEPVDWTPFDLVAVDLYRDRHNAADYRDQLRSYLAHGKPVAITEFGCCTYRGAADRGGLGFAILDSSGAEPRLDCVYERSEDEQVSYFDDLFGIFTEEKIEAAFWFTFAGYELPHRAEPRDDLDLASYGAVKVVDLTTIGADSAPGWEPKAVFHAIAHAYRRTNTQPSRSWLVGGGKPETFRVLRGMERRR